MNVAEKIKDPRMRVVMTWIWKAIGMVIFYWAVRSVVHSGRPFFPLEAKGFSLSLAWEAVFVGLFPLLFTAIGRDGWRGYGLRKKNLALSMAYSAGFTGFVFAMFMAFRKLSPPPPLRFDFGFPWNPLMGIASILVWGVLMARLYGGRRPRRGLRGRAGAVAS